MERSIIKNLYTENGKTTSIQKTTDTTENYYINLLTWTKEKPETINRYNTIQKQYQKK